MINKYLRIIFVLILFSMTSCKKEDSIDKKTDQKVSNTSQI